MSPEPTGWAGETVSAWPMCHLLGSWQQCFLFVFFFLFQLYLNIIDIQKLHIFKVYSLMSFNICMHLGNQLSN